MFFFKFRQVFSCSKEVAHCLGLYAFVAFGSVEYLPAQYLDATTSVDVAHIGDINLLPLALMNIAYDDAELYLKLCRKPKQHQATVL